MNAFGQNPGPVPSVPDEHGFSLVGYGPRPGDEIFSHADRPDIEIFRYSTATPLLPISYKLLGIPAFLGQWISMGFLYYPDTPGRPIIKKVWINPAYPNIEIRRSVPSPFPL